MSYKQSRQNIPIFEMGSDTPVWITRSPSGKYNTLCKHIYINFFNDEYEFDLKIDKENEMLLFQQHYVSSIFELFPYFPENVVETILFNLDDFRKHF